MTTATTTAHAPQRSAFEQVAQVADLGVLLHSILQTTRRPEARGCDNMRRTMRLESGRQGTVRRCHAATPRKSQRSRDTTPHAY
jgi:hypothetical protein